MITKSEQCLKCAYLHDCDLWSSRDRILDEVKNNNNWKELMGQYFKNGTFSNNKIIDDLILALSISDNMREFSRKFFILLYNDLSSPQHCVSYKPDNDKDDNKDNTNSNTIKW